MFRNKETLVLILLVLFSIMFRNNELFVAGRKNMQQVDMERFAFLYLCGYKDEAILTENERMTFMDFDRLTYLTDILGFTYYNLEIWNKYVGQFKEQFNALIQLINDDYPDELKSPDQDPGYRLHDMWLHDFCNNAPTEELQEWLTHYVEEICEENGLEYEEENSED